MYWDKSTALSQSVPSIPTINENQIEMNAIVIVNSKPLKCHSKDKRREPAYLRADSQQTSLPHDNSNASTSAGHEEQKRNNNIFFV